MNRYRALILFFVPVSCLTLVCGSSNRQLQSITINSAVSGQRIQFTATGTFSAAPITVTPLPVSWSFAPPPPRYTLTTQPFLVDCEHRESPGPIVAMAPAAADAASSGSRLTTKMISASRAIPCP